MSNLTVFLDKYQLAARYGRSHHTITTWRKRRASALHPGWVSHHPVPGGRVRPGAGKADAASAVKAPVVASMSKPTMNTRTITTPTTT